MFVIDIIKTLVNGSSLYQKNRAEFLSLTPTERMEYYESLQGISYSEPTYDKVGTKEKPTVASSIKATGTLPSVASVVSSDLSGIGLGYGLGRLTGKSQKQIEKEGSLPVDDIKQLIWIPLVSRFATMGLEHFLFEKYLGGDIGGVTIPFNKVNKAIIAQIDQSPNLGNDIYNISKTQVVIEDKAKYDKAVEGAHTAILADLVVKGTEAIANTYHGYHRHNKSKAWGLVWGMFGNLGLAMSQGYAQEIRTTPTKVLMASSFETLNQNPYVKAKSKPKSKKARAAKRTRRAKHSRR